MAAESLRVLSGDTIDPLGALVIAPEINEIRVFSGADEISGRFLEVDCEGCSIWRPSVPFDEGAVLALDSEQYGGTTLRVETGASAQLPRVSVLLREELSRSLDSVCCPEDGNAYGPAPSGTPVSSEADPRCPSTLLGPNFEISLAVSDGRQGQVLLKVDSWPTDESGPRDFFLAEQLGGLSLLSNDGAGGAAAVVDEVCVSGESWDLITDAKNEFALCEQVPVFSLAPEPQEPVFSQIRECPLPPEGYKSDWCAGMDYECRLLADRLIGFEQDDQVRSCRSFYDLCGVDAPGGQNPTEAPDPSCASTAGGSGRPWGLLAFYFLVLAASAKRRHRPPRGGRVY